MKAIHLKTARKRKHWTQEQLEAASGVAQSAISKLEKNAEASPELVTAIKLADALEVDVRALRFGPDPKKQRQAAA